jgi:hypothetical protein
VPGSRSERESHQRSAFVDRESREFAAPALQARKHSTTSPDANDVFQKFNPDTRWVAAGLLGALLLADLAFAVLLPERHTVTEVLSERASQAESGSPRNENAATRFRSTDLRANLSRSAVTPGTLPLVEQRSSEVHSLRNGGCDNGI